jgi:hypothetical protein
VSIAVGPVNARADEHAQLPRTTVMAGGLSTRQGPPAEPALPEPLSVTLKSNEPACVQASPASVPPATVTDDLPEDLDCAPLWQLWTAIVDDLVKGQPANIDDAAYLVLHGRLVHAAQIQARSRPAPNIFALVQTVVEPWLSLNVLAQTDRQTLASLAQRCRQLDHELGLKRTPRRLPPWVFVAALFLLSVAIGTLVMTGAWSIQPSAALAWLWQTVKAKPLLTLAAAVPPLAVGAVYFWSRCSPCR